MCDLRARKARPFLLVGGADARRIEGAPPLPSEGKIGRAVITIAVLAAAGIAVAVSLVVGFAVVQWAAQP